MPEGFTIKCNKCGTEIQIKSKEDLYTLHAKKISIMNHPEQLDGFIKCSNCRQQYNFNIGGR